MRAHCAPDERTHRRERLTSTAPTPVPERSEGPDSFTARRNPAVRCGQDPAWGRNAIARPTNEANAANTQRPTGQAFSAFGLPSGCARALTNEATEEELPDGIAPAQNEANGGL